MKLHEILSEDLKQKGTFGTDQPQKFQGPGIGIHSPESKFAALNAIKPNPLNRPYDPSRIERDYDSEDANGKFAIKKREEVEIDRDAQVPDSIRKIANELGIEVEGRDWGTTRPETLEVSKQFAKRIAEIGTLYYETDQSRFSMKLTNGSTTRKYDLEDCKVQIRNKGNMLPYADPNKKDQFYDYLYFNWSKK